MSQTEDTSLVLALSLNVPTQTSIPNPNNLTAPEGSSFPLGPVPSTSALLTSSALSNTPKWATLLQMMISSQTQLQTQQAQLHDLITNSP